MPSCETRHLKRSGHSPGDPIHHVAAVGSAERAHAIRIQPRILLKRGGQSQLEVLERLAAPIAADRVGESLAVAGRAVKVDHHDAVAGAGKTLRIPAPVPLIRHASLRSAVHDESHRVFLVALETRRLDEVAEDVFIVPAGKAELLVLAELALVEQRLIQMRELLRRPAAEPHRVEIRRTRQRAQREEDFFRTDAETLDLAVAGDRGGSAGRRVDGPQRPLPQMIRGRVQSLAVARPCEARDRAVPILGQRVLDAGLQIEQHQMKAVGLESRPVHGEVGEQRAVGRVGRLSVPRRIVRGHVVRGVRRPRAPCRYRSWSTRARRPAPRAPRTPLPCRPG